MQKNVNMANERVSVKSAEVAEYVNMVNIRLIVKSAEVANYANHHGVIKE